MNGWVVTTVAGCAVAGLLSAAPQAKADDQAFIDLISNNWVYHIYGAQALTAEAHKVCQTLAGGPPSAEAIRMVEVDMSLPRFTAVDVVNAAKDGLC